MTRRLATGGVKLAVSLLLAAGGLGLAACGSGVGTAGGPVVRDSAGVQIVESERAAWDDGKPWRLSATPLLEIGVTEGGSLY